MSEQEWPQDSDLPRPGLSAGASQHSFAPVSRWLTKPKVEAQPSPSVFRVERKSVTPERDTEGVSGNGGVGLAVGLVVAVEAALGAVRRDQAGTGGVW